MGGAEELFYYEDVKKIHTVLADSCEHIAKVKGIDICIYKGTQSFEDSAIIYKLRFFCPPGDKPERTRDAMRVIQDGLDAADIHIPYNQLDVHTITHLI